MLAPSDFSALKNFVRQPVHKNRSKFCFVDSQFVTRNVFSSPRRFFYLNPPVSNQNNRVWAGGKKADVKLRSLPIMWWLACVLVARDDSTSLTRALKWILRTTLAVSFPVLSRTALDCCPVDTSYSKTTRQHTETARAMQNWLQTNCPDFIAKDQWPPNSPDLTPWIIRITMSGGNVGGLSQAPSETENDRRTEGSPAWWSGTAYLRDQ